MRGLWLLLLLLPLSCSEAAELAPRGRIRLLRAIDDERVLVVREQSGLTLSLEQVGRGPLWERRIDGLPDPLGIVADEERVTLSPVDRRRHRRETIALDLATGDTLWAAAAVDGARATAPPMAPTLVDGGLQYELTGAGRGEPPLVIAIVRASGAERFREALDDRRSRVWAAEGRLFVAGPAGGLVARSGGDRHPIGPTGARFCSSGSLLFYVDGVGDLHRVDARTLSDERVHRALATSLALPRPLALLACAARGERLVLFLGERDRSGADRARLVAALDGGGADVAWSVPLPEGGALEPPIGPLAAVALFRTGPLLRGLDVDRGQLLFTRRLPGGFAVVAAEELVYVRGGRGELFRIETDGGRFVAGRRVARGAPLHAGLLSPSHLFVAEGERFFRVDRETLEPADPGFRTREILGEVDRLLPLAPAQ